MTRSTEARSKNFGGRPRQREKKAGERAHLGVLVTREMKKRLETAAQQTGRSQSQEAELRLERSFDHQDLLSEALTLAYGRKVAGIVMALGIVMDGAAKKTTHVDWTDQPKAFDDAVQAASTLLTAARPKGAVREPSSGDVGASFTREFIQAIRGLHCDKPGDEVQIIASKALQNPLSITHDEIKTLTSAVLGEPKSGYPWPEQAETIKRLLGPIAERMSPEYDAVQMAPRSNWKGFLKLSLVSASIAIYPATSSSEKVGFNTLNRGTGNRQVEDDELAEIGIDSTHTVDIEKFVPKASIDDRYRDTPYYLGPEDQLGQQAFALIREAMKKKKMVGIARVVMARRERIMMLEPLGKGIMGTLLHYPYEIRSEAAVFDEVPDLKLPDQMLELAGHIIDRMTGELEPFEEHIRGTQPGLPAPKEKATARPSNVINLVDALRRSIEAA